MTLIPDLKQDRWGRTFGPMLSADPGVASTTSDYSKRDIRPQLDVIGKSVAIGPLDLERTQEFETWMNLPRPQFQGTMELDEAELILDDESAMEPAPQNVDDLYFTIYEVDTWRPIGGAALMEIDYDEALAEFSLVIGESDSRGKGYGSEATRLALDYAFKALGLNNIMLRVFEYNFAARQAFQNAGFREFTRRKACHLEGSRLWDEIYMGCMASDFGSQTIGDILVPNQLRA